MQNTQINSLFHNLWESYLEVTPSAMKIHELLGSAENSDIENDHIALRTFNDERINLKKLAQHFEALGYEECGDYVFEKKFLKAKHFEHRNPSFPKVFISELEIEKLSEKAQTILNYALSDLSPSIADKEDFLWSGKHWNVFYKEYELLREESEYAAWMYVWGFRANHFTVCVNALQNFENIEDVNQTLKMNGFELNTSGGEIKGSTSDLLKQSSTLADVVEIPFVEGTVKIPSCFYEFAQRYKQKDGDIFTGFIANSADKIFESTDARQPS